MPHVHDIATVEIDPVALDMIPEAIARESSVLPVAVVDDELRVILPADDRTAETIDRLRFVLNMQVIYDTADREQIRQAIDRLYPGPSADSPATIDSGLPLKFGPIAAEADYVFLDLIGRVTHVTDASVSFDLGRKTNVLELSDGTREVFGEDRVFVVIGWLDAHFPCHGFHKLMIRCSLPCDRVSYESMRDLIPCVTRTLALPDNVSYKIYLESRSHATSMECNRLSCV